MNARTSRLLRRVAFAMQQTDNRSHPETLNQHQAGLKKRWNETPRPARRQTRVALVAMFNAIVTGA